MSLGGYTAALAATLEPDLISPLPMIPLGFAPRLRARARWPQRVGGGCGARTVVARRGASPGEPARRALARGPERLLVIGARADRIAARLPRRAGSPIISVRRSSLGTAGTCFQFGRGEAFGKIAGLFATLGIIPPALEIGGGYCAARAQRWVSRITVTPRLLGTRRFQSWVIERWPVKMSRCWPLHLEPAILREEAAVVQRLLQGRAADRRIRARRAACRAGSRLASTATVRSGVMGLPVAPRPHGNCLGSSRSKQIF